MFSLTFEAMRYSGLRVDALDLFTRPMPCSLHTEVFSDEVERSLPFCVGTIKELHVSLSLQKPPPGEEQDSVGLAEFFAACRAVEDLKVHCYESPGSFWLLAVPDYECLHLVD